MFENAIGHDESHTFRKTHYECTLLSFITTRVLERRKGVEEDIHYYTVQYDSEIQAQYEGGGLVRHRRVIARLEGAGFDGIYIT